MANNDAPNRWWIATATFVVLFPLGGVYGWSVFVEPLQEEFDWTWTQSMAPLMANMAFIVVGSFIGGAIQDRIGPRWVAVTGVLMYCLGVGLASLAGGPDDLWLMVLTYGVIGGTGLGVAYITCPAMIVKWFPDKRGMAAGLATLGFGAGALATGPIGEWLLGVVGSVPGVFWILALGYLVVGLPFCLAFQDPPEDWEPPQLDEDEEELAELPDYEVRDALRTWQWYALATVLLVNITIGIALVTMASPLTQEITGEGAAAGAAIVSVLGVWNGLGRPGLAALSDKIGRKQTFVSMLAAQAVCFAALPFAENIVLFGVLASVIALCFGGGFGTMPAMTADYFGPEHNGAIFGAMVVAWSAGGVIGPLAISQLREATGTFAAPLWVFAGLALVTIGLAAVVKPPGDRKVGEEREATDSAEAQAGAS
jgi:MFS transporter, OFA family, oxalate/formate antiporter